MRSNLTKWIPLVGVVFLLVAVAIANVIPPAPRYEISLYGAYPPYFWIIFLGATFAGALTILRCVSRPADSSWVFGVWLMVLSSALLLLLPFARGYYMYVRGDPLTHLGYTIDILNAGEPIGNIYPPIHLLAVALAGATGFELRTIAMLVPFVLSMLYFGGMFYLVSSIFESRRRILIALPFVLLPILRYAHPEFRPFGVAVMLIPVLFYLFVRGQRTNAPQVRVAFVTVLIGVILYHPLTGLFVTAIFALWVAGRYIPSIQTLNSRPTHVVSLSAVVFLAWYSNFTGIILRFDSVYESLFGAGGGETPADSYSQTLEQASPAVLDLLRVATFRFGIEALLFSLGFVLVGTIAYLAVRREYPVDVYMLVLGGTLATFSFGGLAFLLSDLIVPHYRPFQIAKISSALIAGQLFYLMWHRFELGRDRSEIRTLVGVALIATLLVLATFSTVGVHHSPIESESNQQVTEMKFSGAAWITEHGTATDNALRVGVQKYRFHNALYGAGTTSPHFPRENTDDAPPRFRYDERPYVGDNYAEDQYILVDHRIRIFYQEVYPNYEDQWRYTPADFERLEEDRTVTRVYDNGDSTQYLVRGTAG